MKRPYFVGWIICLCAVLVAFAESETLTVAQGETVDRGPAYKNWYNSALTVSGTLNVFTGGNYYLCAVNDAGTYDSTKAVPLRLYVLFVKI